MVSLTQYEHQLSCIPLSDLDIYRLLLSVAERTLHETYKLEDMLEKFCKITDAYVPDNMEDVQTMRFQRGSIHLVFAEY